MKSIAIVEKGFASDDGKIGESGAFCPCVLTLLRWQSAHPFTYCSTSLAILGHHRCCRIRCVVLEIPGCPMVGGSWYWLISCRRCIGSTVTTSQLSFHHLPCIFTRLWAFTQGLRVRSSWGGNVMRVLMKSSSGRTTTSSLSPSP